MSSVNINNNFNLSSPKSNKKNNLDSISSEAYKSLATCSYPFCNCIKCKINQEKDAKNKQNLKKSYSNYQNILETTDSNSPNQKSYLHSESKNKSNISILDNCFKEYLKSGLQSVMKRDFISNRIETSESIIPKDSILNSNKGSPFIGRSMNSIMFPEFLISPKKKKPHISEDLLKIPFSGNSAYKENYEKFDDRYYMEKASPFLKKDNLESMGRLITETTSQNTYKKNLNLESNKEKLKQNFKDINSYSNLGINPPHYKDNYMSQYKRSYIFDKENAKKNANKVMGL